ncbi:hypothetical protein SETIT_5G229500v2 [Setaria italica]|uniref:Uncharacterized protein n=1 Tax=Setaria italica TaxID=4555 RepID=A0A368R7Q9_SETIT|nr:hypothetical protein SETIT_5G229500v2 [Setaria italica]
MAHIGPIPFVGVLLQLSPLSEDDVGPHWKRSGDEPRRHRGRMTKANGNGAKKNQQGGSGMAGGVRKRRLRCGRKEERPPRLLFPFHALRRRLSPPPRIVPAPLPTSAGSVRIPSLPFGRCWVHERLKASPASLRKPLLLCAVDSRRRLDLPQLPRARCPLHAPSPPPLVHAMRAPTVFWDKHADIRRAREENELALNQSREKDEQIKKLRNYSGRVRKMRRIRSWSRTRFRPTWWRKFKMVKTSASLLPYHKYDIGVWVTRIAVTVF